MTNRKSKACFVQKKKQEEKIPNERYSLKKKKKEES